MIRCSAATRYQRCHSEVAPAAAVSAGALLRQARQAPGGGAGGFGGDVKSAGRKLQALEDEDWQRLPDVVFLRALAQTICRTLHLEAAPVLALLPQQKVTALAPQGGLNAPMRERGVPSILRYQHPALPLACGGVVAHCPGRGRLPWGAVDGSQERGAWRVHHGACPGPNPAGDSPLFSPAGPEEGDGGGYGRSSPGRRSPRSSSCGFDAACLAGGRGCAAASALQPRPQLLRLSQQQHQRGTSSGQREPCAAHYRQGGHLGAGVGCPAAPAD